jgi:hypothetical protein
LTPKTHKDALRMLAQHVIVDRHDVDTSCWRALSSLASPVGSLDEFSLG